MPGSMMLAFQSSLFQSTPAPKGGRCAGAGSTTRRRQSFNPHPPRKAGDASDDARLMRKQRSFNPHPPRKAGDAPAFVCYVRHNPFQSTPAPKGGRCDLHHHGPAHVHRVSIHARPEERAMQTSALRSAPFLSTLQGHIDSFITLFLNLKRA